MAIFDNFSASHAMYMRVTAKGNSQFVGLIQFENLQLIGDDLFLTRR